MLKYYREVVCEASFEYEIEDALHRMPISLLVKADFKRWSAMVVKNVIISNEKDRYIFVKQNTKKRASKQETIGIIRGATKKTFDHHFTV